MSHEWWEHRITRVAETLPKQGNQLQQTFGNSPSNTNGSNTDGNSPDQCSQCCWHPPPHCLHYSVPPGQWPREKIRDIQKTALVHQEVIPLTRPLVKFPAYLGHFQNMQIELRTLSPTARITMISASRFSLTLLKMRINKGSYDTSLLYPTIRLIKLWCMQSLSTIMTQSSGKQLQLIQPSLLSQ